MAENEFFRSIKGQELSGFFGGSRKVAHSFTNYFSSIDRTAFGFKEKTPEKKNFSMNAGSIVNAGSKAVGSSGTVLGTMGMGAGIAVLAVAATASAGFVVAISGPIAAVIGGVLGLIVLAKSAYSNRTAAHVALTPYCWTMIDDKTPTTFGTRQKLYDASAAALVLLEDGKSQISLMGHKLQEAGNKLKDVNQELRDNELKIAQRANAANGTLTPEDIAEMKRLKELNLRIIDRGLAEGGAIWEFTRRVVHVGNYIQAAAVVALAMRDKIDTHAFVAATLPDPFAGTQMGTASRALFTDLGKLYEGIRQPPTSDAARGSQASANVAKFKPGTLRT